MKSEALVFAAGLSVAGFIGSAMAAVPDPSPFIWSAPLSVVAEVELPDVPPPPSPRATRGAAGADIVLVTPPRVSVPCPDRAMRVRAAATKPAPSGGRANS